MFSLTNYYVVYPTNTFEQLTSSHKKLTHDECVRAAPHGPSLSTLSAPQCRPTMSDKSTWILPHVSRTFSSQFVPVAERCSLHSMRCFCLCLSFSFYSVIVCYGLWQLLNARAVIIVIVNTIFNPQPRPHIVSVIGARHVFLVQTIIDAAWYMMIIRLLCRGGRHHSTGDHSSEPAVL